MHSATCGVLLMSLTQTGARWSPPQSKRVGSGEGSTSSLRRSIFLQASHCLPQGTNRIALQPLLTSSLRRYGKYKRELSASTRVVSNRDIASVGLHDFADDRKSQTGALALRSFSTPKPVENMLSVRHWHAASVVSNTHTAIVKHCHGNLTLGGRVNDTVFHEIPDGVRDRVAVASDLNRLFCTDKGNASFLRDRPGRQIFDDGTRDA